MIDEPASRAVARLLRQAIAEGTYLPGEQLPSQRLLAQTHQIAMNTAREAYRLLADEGIVVRRHGSGVFVTTRELPVPATSQSARLHHLEEEVRLLEDRVSQLEQPIIGTIRTGKTRKGELSR